MLIHTKHKHTSLNNLVYAKFSLCFLCSKNCTEAENLRDADFYRNVIVYTPFAATAMGLAAICLLALLDYCKKKEMKRILTVNEERASIQIGE